ncbi:unnamed protein product [Lactuca saligna]|uniref:Uncharacterized protein n=1 Tax=Lactuca saligna TaxID=75948 RepID=A0AA35YPT6_LACSI|nr:unnamed protein product [Lactuca saligna]
MLFVNRKFRIKESFFVRFLLLKDLKSVVKERHILFIQDVKKVQEDANYKLQELRQDMEKEIANVRTEFASLNQKVDIMCDPVTKFAKLYESLSPQITQISITENKNFIRYFQC